MAGDLFDEAEIGARERIGSTVSKVGGDLLDEAEVVEGNIKELPASVQKKINDDERTKLFDAINADMGVLEKFAVGAGRGITTIGRAVGLADPEDPGTTEAFGRLKEDSTAASIGEIVGEAAPFLPLGVASGAIKSLAPRVAASVGIGAAEGAAITRGKGGGTTETIGGAGIGGVVAGGLEAISPVLGKLGGALFKRLGRTPKGPLLDDLGIPTEEFKKALADTNTNFSDLTKEAVEEVNIQGLDITQATRKARFESQGIPSTAGDITQDFRQQAAESRLLSQATDESGEALRGLRAQQSTAFEEEASKLVNELGVADDVGESIKDALSGRKKLLNKEKRDLYNSVFDANPDVKAVPIITDNISAALPDVDTLDDLSITSPEAVDKVKAAMARFGISVGEEADQILKDKKLTVQPLTAGNFERFRKTINAIERSDLTGAAKVITGPIKRALDEEGDLIADAIKASDVKGGEFIETLKQARSVTRQVKTEFSPQAITGRLVDVKRDGVTPIIESSKVVRELLRPTAPIENVQKVVESLSKAGKEGSKGLKDLQASVVMNALDNAFKAASRKTAGVQTVGGNQFAKSLTDLGEDKLKLIFKGNTKGLQRLKNLKQTALDITPADAATPKGSAPIILDAINAAGRMPGLAAVKQVAEFVVKAGADERAIRRAMNSRPAFKRAVTIVEQEFPALAAPLGVSFIVSEE